MGRPRGRKRSRGRADDDDGGAADPGQEEEEEDLALFPVGAEVEVRSDEQGFADSYYEATVEGYLPHGRGYQVAYATLSRREDGRSPHREHVAAADVRPRPPLAARCRREFVVHEMVEAFHNDGWWAGVVCRAEADGEDEESQSPRRTYAVCFPTTREVLEFDEARLRPRLVFLRERWVAAAKAESRSPMFKEGTQVEVSRSPKTFGESWSPANVLKVIDATTFLVQYGDVGEDGELVTEIMDSQYIRPWRNISHMDSKYRFAPSSFVEVFNEGSWWPGVILEVLDDKFMKKYVVKIKNHETDMDDVECVDVMTVEHTQLRPRYDWYGRKWVRCVTEKQCSRGQLNRAHPSTSMKRQISAAVQFSSDNNNIAVLASCINNDDIRDEPGSSIEEKKNNAAAMLEAVYPDLSMSNKIVEIKQKPSLYPEETVKQQSVLTITSSLVFPSQLSVSGLGNLKYDPQFFRSNKPRMISVPSAPQTRQLQASLFGAFGQLRPLPQCPVLGIQSINPSFASIGGSKKAFSVQEKHPTDKGYYLMADPQDKTNAGSFVGTALYRKRRNECICSQTPVELGENAEYVLTKKRIVDKNVEETSQNVASFEEQMNSKNDYDQVLPHDGTPCSGTVPGIDTVDHIDSTPSKDAQGPRERSVFLRESSAAEENIACGIPIGTDELHQDIGPPCGAIDISILSECAVHSVIDLDKPCEGNVLLSDSSTHQNSNKATKAENSEISMEHEANEEFFHDVLFLANDSTIDLLPSEKSCEVIRNDHELHKDNAAAVVQIVRSCVVPTDNVPRMSSDLVQDILLSSENSEDDRQADMGVADCHGNRMELSSVMSETQHANANDPVSATSLLAFKGDIPINQSSKKNSAADEHRVPHLDSSASMVESAAECSQSIDTSALTLLSSADMGNYTESEPGNGLIEPKDTEGTPMSKYVHNRTEDSCCPLLQRSHDVHKSILADEPSKSLAVENLPFVKKSPMWAQIEAMEIFSKMSRQPNFHQFQQHVPELREGKALGLMISFANLGESIMQMSVKDDKSLFEEKMKGLSSLEADGFDVRHLRSHLVKLIGIKSSHAELHDVIKKMKEKISHEETVDRQLGAQIGMLNSTIHQLDLYAHLLRGMMQSTVSQKIYRAWEISRLKVESYKLEQRIASTVEAPW